MAFTLAAAAALCWLAGPRMAAAAAAGASLQHHTEAEVAALCSTAFSDDEKGSENSDEEGTEESDEEGEVAT